MNKKNTVVQNRNPKRARHDAKNPIFNKQSINIAYRNVHGLKEDKADLIRSRSSTLTLSNLGLSIPLSNLGGGGGQNPPELNNSGFL